MQQSFALQHPALVLKMPRNVWGDSEDSYNAAVRAVDGIFAIVNPILFTFLVSELHKEVGAAPLGNRPLFKLVSDVGNGFRMNVVIGLAGQIA